tara:strand:- start:110 stop:562 length:453 start_codon:yes stop_codon:yes gene_type:complete
MEQQNFWLRNLIVKFNRNMQINELTDLNSYKTAPLLDLNQIQKLSIELDKEIRNSDWLTIGIMAKSDHEAKNALRTFLRKYSSISFNDFEKLKAIGNVFLKGNQKTGEVYIRSEYGLGEGILLTCQYDDSSRNSLTYGPFPLSFFVIKNY